MTLKVTISCDDLDLSVKSRKGMCSNITFGKQYQMTEFSRRVYMPRNTEHNFQDAFKQINYLQKEQITMIRENTNMFFTG